MLLLSKKSFEECRKNGMKTKENRISPSRWKKKKKIESAVVEIVVWLQPISTIQPIQSRGSFIQFDKCEKSHFSFILSFSNFTNCCEQADFKPLSTFLVFNNPQIKKKTEKQNKFKTCFANAVEISIISTNLIKITLSQITIQKEWRLFSICENC